MTAVYVPQLSQRRVVMSDYHLNINPGNQLSATCFSSRRVVKVSVSTCYHETLDKRTLLLLTEEEIMQIQHWTGSKTDGISM